MTVTETIRTCIAMETGGRRVEIRASKGLTGARLVDLVKLLTAQLEQAGEEPEVETERQPRQRRQDNAVPKPNPVVTGEAA